MRRLAFALALAVVVTAGASAQTLATVRLGLGPVDVVTPLLYGVKSGIYAKAGIDLQLVKLSNGPAIAAAVAGGAVELAQAATLSVVQAYAKGIPFTIIGNLAYYQAARPDDALLVLAGSSIRAPKDLLGKTLATVSLSGMPTLGTYAWLESQGIDPSSSIKWVELPAAATLAAMEAGRVDGAVLYEPFFSAEMATKNVRVLAFPYDVLGKRFSNAVLFSSDAWVHGHPDLVNRFLRATGEASAYVGAHEGESAALISEFAGVDLATATNIHHEGRGVAITPADVQPIIDVAARFKFIPNAFPAQQLICSCAFTK